MFSGIPGAPCGINPNHLAELSPIPLVMCL